MQALLRYYGRCLTQWTDLAMGHGEDERPMLHEVVKASMANSEAHAIAELIIEHRRSALIKRRAPLTPCIICAGVVRRESATRCMQGTGPRSKSIALSMLCADLK